MTGLQIKMILLSVTYGLLIGCIVFFVVRKLTLHSRNAESRVRKIVGAQIGSENVLVRARRRGSKKKKKDGETYVRKKSIVDKIGDALFEELLAANILMKPEEFATIWIAVAFVPGAILALFVKNMFIPIVFVFCGVLGPIVYIKVKKNKRTAQFEDQLGDALMIASSSLRSGLTFPQAMETISRDMYPPISEEFGRAVNEINMGYSLDSALDNIYDRVKSEDFKIAAVAISVQRQTGGNLSDILTTISDTIKERAQLKREVKSAPATGRMSGLIVGLMPIAITVVLNMATPGYLDPLFTKTGGRIALAIGVGLEIMGLLVIKKITTIKY